MKEDLDLKDILKKIYIKRKILIYILLISIIIGMFYTFIIKRPQYKITSQILIDKTDASIEKFITSKDIINGKEIEVSFDKTTRIISVLGVSNKSNLDKIYNDVNSYIQVLQPKLEETYSIKVFNIIEKPQIPEKAYNVSYFQDISICTVSGIIIYGIYIIILLNMRGLSNSFEVENITKINVLGCVDLDNKKQNINENVYNTKSKLINNQFKMIEANIEFNKENLKPKTILVTGTEKNVGTTYIVNNLANQYEKIYNKILLIDTDIISKRLTNVYKKNNENGITNILELKEVEQVEKFIQKTDKENVFLLPVGNSVVEEDIFLKEDVKDILDELKKKYDIIIIDSLSINNHVIPIHLTSISDATLIVMESGKTKQEQIQKAKSTIEKVGGKITGIIINKVF